MNRSEKIKTEIENLKNEDNSTYLKKILKKNIDIHTIAYFAYDDLSYNPYRQNISRAVLYNNELKTRTKQTYFMMISAVATLISTIIALVTVITND